MYLLINVSTDTSSSIIVLPWRKGYSTSMIPWYDTVPVSVPVSIYLGGYLVTWYHQILVMYHDMYPLRNYYDTLRYYDTG